MPKGEIAKVVTRNKKYYATTYEDMLYHPLYKDCLQDSKEGTSSLLTQEVTTQVHPTTTLCNSCTAPLPGHGLQRYCAASYGVASVKEISWS
jgi:hypothetical protein